MKINPVLMYKFHSRNSFRQNNSLYFAILRVFPIVQIDEHSTNTEYLENINLILAFIINIISQPIELLNISSAFIV